MSKTELGFGEHGVCSHCSGKCFPIDWLHCIPCDVLVCKGCTPLHHAEHSKKNKEKLMNTLEETREKRSKEYTSEKVDHPNHYHPGRFEAISVIEAWHLDFCLGNAVKYISRAGSKDPAKEIEDLEKAQWYLARRVEYLKGKKREEATKMMHTYGSTTRTEVYVDPDGNTTVTK